MPPTSNGGKRAREACWEAHAPALSRHEWLEVWWALYVSAAFHNASARRKIERYLDAEPLELQRELLTEREQD